MVEQLFSPVGFILAGSCVIILGALAGLIYLWRRRPLLQVPPVEQKRKLKGMAYAIAWTHRTVNQVIGLEMSTANLVAVFLSVVTAVAGTVIYAYQAYQNAGLSAVVGLATLTLAILIENISLNALKNIRLAQDEIRVAEDAYYEQANAQLKRELERFLNEQADQSVPLSLSKEEIAGRERARKERQRIKKDLESQQKRLLNQTLRRPRGDLFWSIPFAVIGVLFSATAGGLFWHLVLAALPTTLNILIGSMFALAVSVTFVMSELFKRVQDEAIKEALRSSALQTEMLKQQAEDMSMEIVIESIEAVKEDPAARKELAGIVLLQMKEVVKLITAQTTAKVTGGGETAMLQISSQTDTLVETIESKIEEIQDVSAETDTPKNEQTEAPAVETGVSTSMETETPVLDNVVSPSTETVEHPMSVPVVADFNVVERIMYSNLVATPGLLQELAQLSLQLETAQLVTALQARFSSHASYITAERVSKLLPVIRSNYPMLFITPEAETKPAFEPETEMPEIQTTPLPQMGDIGSLLIGNSGVEKDETDEPENSAPVSTLGETDPLLSTDPVSVSSAPAVSEKAKPRRKQQDTGELHFSKSPAKPETAKHAAVSTPKIGAMEKKIRGYLEKYPQLESSAIAIKAKSSTQYVNKIKNKMAATEGVPA